MATGTIEKIQPDVFPFVEEYLDFTYSSKSIRIYFRVWGNVLSVLLAGESTSMTLPTSWTNVGSLTNIKPRSDRYISFVSSNGKSFTLRIYTDGGVRIIAHESGEYWLQTSGTVIYK